MSIASAYARSREHMRRRKMWRGGRIAADRQDDDLHVMGHLNTSGEPHTEGLDEITHPMEFMADGGEVEDLEDDAYIPGDSTREVMPEEPNPASKFYQALRRRPRFRP